MLYNEFGEVIVCRRIICGWALAGLVMAGLAMMLSNTMSAPMIAVFSRILLGASLISFLMIAFAHRERGKVHGGLERRGFNVEHARSNVCFADVAANEIALNSLKGLVDFLQHPEKYAQMGARIPRGVLLYGPPGTGKTLLAKALAGEAGVPYYALSGSDFVELYVGVGAHACANCSQKRAKRKVRDFLSMKSTRWAKSATTLLRMNASRHSTRYWQK